MGVGLHATTTCVRTKFNQGVLFTKKFQRTSLHTLGTSSKA